MKLLIDGELMPIIPVAVDSTALLSQLRRRYIVSIGLRKDAYLKNDSYWYVDAELVRKATIEEEENMTYLDQVIRISEELRERYG